jgi:hypothetical protein
MLQKSTNHQSFSPPFKLWIHSSTVMTLFANKGQINFTAASFASVVKPAVASLLVFPFS